jgi:DNA repair protein RecN (Recombination protein N)
MLTEIHIRNFAIIDELTVDIGEGLTVMTGETGAGKSILVDALSLIAGARGAADMVRHGADRAEISASFDLHRHPELNAWLQSQEIATDEDCLVRRVIHASGRSAAFINTSRVSASTLRTLGEQLLNIHGQQANQALLQRATQRRVLDALADHQNELQAVQYAYSQWSEACQRLAALRDEQAQAGAADLDLLQHQVQELEALGIGNDEVESLESELRLLAGAGELLTHAEGALAVLASDETGATDLLARAAKSLRAAADTDTRLGDIAGLLDEAQIQSAEAAGALERYLSEVDLDPARLEQVERRLSALDDVARKHRVPPRELPGLFDTLAERLARWRSASADLEAAESAVAQAQLAYQAAARDLHEARMGAAAGISDRAAQIIRSLGLPNAQFAVSVTWRDGAAPTPHGLDEVVFTISTNPGQPLAPLDSVASGGELSRISLALEVVSAGASMVPCLVFDEVDTGVGGGVAEIVGRRLRELGQAHQVLCVTHLPQVASQAHEHLQVRKHVEDGQTRTRLQRLCEEDVVQELARMLGGVKITERTLAHAREMRERATAA